MPRALRFQSLRFGGSDSGVAGSGHDWSNLWATFVGLESLFLAANVRLNESIPRTTFTWLRASKFLRTFFKMIRFISKLSYANQTRDIQLDSCIYVSVVYCMFFLKFVFLAAFARWLCRLHSFWLFMADNFVQEFVQEFVQQFFSGPRYIVNPQLPAARRT